MARVRGTGRARLEAEARAVRAEAVHGVRADVSLKRDAKAERTGARARLGDGMADIDARALDALRAARADGYLVPRSTREDRAAWHALATQDWTDTPSDDNDITTEGTNQ